MLQAAASWLIATLPLLKFAHDRNEMSRSGNRHRKFIPTDVFHTTDGYLYLAVGNDIQWRRLVEIPKFATIPWARVNDLYAVSQLPAIRSKLTQAKMSDGRPIALQPWPVDGEDAPRELSFPPAYGEHTRAILAEAGFSPADIDQLVQGGIAYSTPEG